MDVLLHVYRRRLEAPPNRSHYKKLQEVLSSERPVKQYKCSLFVNCSQFHFVLTLTEKAQAARKAVQWLGMKPWHESLKDFSWLGRGDGSNFFQCGEESLMQCCWDVEPERV